MTRRALLATPVAAFAAAQSRLPIRKAVEFSMLPKSMSIADRFKLGIDCGFEQIECPTTDDPAQVEEMKKAAESSGLRIHSVMNLGHWKYPLSSPDAGVVAACVKGMETSLRNAHFWGADTVLLVPAVVDAKTGYRDAWKRSQEQIRLMIPLAKELHVVIGVEEVWNKFLLSPIEFASYLDSFNSPWVKAYFDVGNVVINSYPQDWIRILGPRIVKLHIKDFKFAKREAQFTALREGEIDWPEVYRALAEISYKGSATVELPGGDKDYLTEVSRRFDLILSGT